VTATPGVRVAYRYSPDGRSIAWTKNLPDGHSEIMIRNLKDGTDRQLTHDAKFADDPLWTHTGHIIYSSNRGGNINLWMMPVDGGEPVQVTRGGGPDVPLGITADGKQLMYSELQDIGQVKIADVNTGVIRQVTMDDRERGGPRYPPAEGMLPFPRRRSTPSVRRGTSTSCREMEGMR